MIQLSNPLSEEKWYREKKHHAMVLEHLSPINMGVKLGAHPQCFTIPQIKVLPRYLSSL